MDDRLIGLFLVMERLGGFKIDKLEDRVLFQKAIYLLQLLRVDFRFRFSWYIRGPYSKELTSCGYEIRERSQEIANGAVGLRLRAEVESKIDVIKRTIDSCPATLEKERWLELIASIHYLKNISLPASSPLTLQDTGEKLKEFGKRSFQTAEIAAAWSKLEELGILDSKLAPAN